MIHPHKSFSPISVLTLCVEAIALLCVVLICSLAGPACTATPVEPVKTAASVGNVRQTVCAAIALNAASDPRLAPLVEACQRGDELRDIAAAYAGCSYTPPAKPTAASTAPDASAAPVVEAPTEPAQTAPSPSDATVVDPWPDSERK